MQNSIISEQKQRSCKIGCILPQANGSFGGGTPAWQDILALAHHAEDLGFDSLWVVDEYFIRETNQEATGFWECWSLLSALAACTSRATLGSLVTCNGYRHPALLAKIASTVDEISGGRVMLGLGVGYNQQLNEDFGLPWNQRYSCFEEALIILQSLLQTGYVDFQGQHYRVRDCELCPRGPRLAGPPLLIGTMAHPGPRMLRLIAQYAQSWAGCLIFETDPFSLLPSLCASVDEACTRLQRPVTSLERIATVPVAIGQQRVLLGTQDITASALTGTPEEIAKGLQQIASHGFSHLVLQIEPNTLAGLDAIAPVLAYLAHL